MTDLLNPLSQYRPPQNWIKLTTIDAHTAGEPLRIIVSGYPDLAGDSILAQRRDAMESYDKIRAILMWEPRGHADMYGCVVVPPVSQAADFGVLFMHNEGYSSMCGHGIIALAKVAVVSDMVEKVEPETKVCIDTPSGMVTAWVKVADDRVGSVRFHNVPSYVVQLDATVDVPGIGQVRYDLAFGGAYYAYVNAADLNLTCHPDEHSRLVEYGMKIKQAIIASRDIKHPFEDDLSFLYGTIFVARPLGDDAHSRNVCVFAEGEVDRSPTGTGVAGRLALHHARGEIGIDVPIEIESIIGSKFSGRVVETLKFGPYDAIIPEIKGEAFITGRHEFVVDPEDQLATGFILR